MMCLILIFVSEILDMPPRNIPLSQLKDDFGDVHKTLANIVVVLQQQVEAGFSRGTP